jgi:isoamylase
VVALRNKHPLFRRLTFFRGRAVRDSDAKDIVWLQPDGGEMSDEEWSQGHARCLGAHLSGRGLSERDEHGVPVEDDDLMLLFNASDHEIAFRLGMNGEAPWHVRVDTDSESGVPPHTTFAAGAEYPLRSRSLVLLCRPRQSR